MARRDGIFVPAPRVWVAGQDGSLVLAPGVGSDIPLGQKRWLVCLYLHLHLWIIALCALACLCVLQGSPWRRRCFAKYQFGILVRVLGRWPRLLEGALGLAIFSFLCEQSEVCVCVSGVLDASAS